MPSIPKPNSIQAPSVAIAPLEAIEPNVGPQPAPLYVPVYLSRQKKIESMPLEQYVRGVLAAEMPIEFELEALKAQAMAARTYIIRKEVEQDFSNVPVSGAWVTDTIAHQAYTSEADLKARWGERYASNSDKLNQAIAQTEGVILTYEQKPIQANFFSTSNGFTENSEDYWSAYIPYLRSVPSPWDIQLSPRYKDTVTFSTADLQSKLGISKAVPASGRGSLLQVVERSQGHRIKQIRIEGKLYSGREIREKLGLNSSQFQWSWKGDRLEVTTFGYGHGVGMSQWGAQGMALEGYKADQIVQYFYTGIELSEASSLVKGNNL
ncbi:stage II sporulation protein D [Paenibacillus sp. S3N08]|uniref:Stage II sporulation protein D n=2 Tax=Paenibacillus agricola TaxID=2716264 RepID=A0ABX0JGL8_9BACL|nr:stage II sporulation protein D [Paenibacillus agricola]